VKNEHAAALGRLNRGRKKNLSPEERARRRANLNTVARPKRWQRSPGQVHQPAQAIANMGHGGC